MSWLSLHSSKGTCRHDKIIVKKKFGIMNEELAKYHDNIGIVMVKSLHSSKGTCRHDKIIVKKKFGIMNEELAKYHDNIGIVMVKSA